MSNKVFYPLTVHILLCLVCYLIFKLTWMGPEAGIIFQYFPNMNRGIVFILSVIIQVIVLLIYWYAGKNIRSLSVRSLLGVGSICIINVISIIVIYYFYRNAGAAIRIFAIYGGASFFLINVISGFSNITNIIVIIAPSIIMFAGNVYGYLKSNH